MTRFKVHFITHIPDCFNPIAINRLYIAAIRFGLIPNAHTLDMHRNPMNPYQYTLELTYAEQTPSLQLD